MKEFARALQVAGIWGFTALIVINTNDGMAIIMAVLGTLIIALSWKD